MYFISTLFNSYSFSKNNVAIKTSQVIVKKNLANLIGCVCDIGE